MHAVSIIRALIGELNEELAERGVAGIHGYEDECRPDTDQENAKPKEMQAMQMSRRRGCIFVGSASDSVQELQSVRSKGQKRVVKKRLSVAT